MAVVGFADRILQPHLKVRGICNIVWEYAGNRENKRKKKQVVDSIYELVEKYFVRGGFTDNLIPSEVDFEYMILDRMESLPTFRDWDVLHKETFTGNWVRTKPATMSIDDSKAFEKSIILGKVTIFIPELEYAIDLPREVWTEEATEATESYQNCRLFF